MLNYLFPVLLVVASNVMYNICAKQTPESAQPLASLTITYLVAAIATAILYYITSQNKNIIADFKHLNWTSFVIGIAIIGLEFGYIQMYRAGWSISVGSLVANIALAIILVFVGVLMYKEHISINQIIGIVFCVVGFIFISKK